MRDVRQFAAKARADAKTAEIGIQTPIAKHRGLSLSHSCSFAFALALEGDRPP